MSYTAHPPRTVAPSSISGTSVDSQAFMQADNYAEMRTLLGIEDLSTLESQAVARAKAVCNFAFPPSVWRADCVSKPGSTGSRWGAAILSASSTNISDTAGEYGGSFVMTTSGLSGGQCEWLGVPNGLSVYGSSLMPDLVRAQDKWFMEWDFKLNSTPDAQTEFGEGWFAADASAFGPMIGLRGAQSTAFFRMFIGDSATGVNSTVAVNTTRNRARMWADGLTPGTIYGSVNGETPISMTGIAFAKGAAPYGRIKNGTTLAAQNVNLYHSIYVCEGVA